MSREFSDEALDAQLLGYLRDRAEDGAARARTPEQVVAGMSTVNRAMTWSARLALRPIRLAWLVVLGLLVLALLAALVAGGRLSLPFPTQIVRIAIELPLGGDDPGAEAVSNGITLALDDAHGQAGRLRIEIPRTAILSDIVGGNPDDQQGAANMRQIAADPDVVAVIGPFNSSVAREQMPISNAAGLLQCSPATTDPQLTQPAGAEIRPTGSPPSSRANYVRVIGTDDRAATGAARYVFQRLRKSSVLIVDDSQGNGMAMADWFEAEFGRLGGSVAFRAGLADSSAAIASMLASARARNPQAIYFSGAGDRGATLLRAAAEAGMGGIPFIGTDALNDGSAATPGSFLGLVGDGAQNAYSVFPGSVNGSRVAAFGERYRASYGSDPTQFAALGYTCAQVVIAAIQQVAANPPTAATGLRDAVRAAGVNPATTFETIIGPIAFDARGDITQKQVAVYAFDASARAWVYADRSTPPQELGGDEASLVTIAAARSTI